MKSLLRARNLTKIYRKKTVVDGISFEVARGEIVGLLGPNGAGKTTSFSMIMGLVKPDNGRIIFGHEDVTEFPVARRARAGIGYLSQEPSIFRRLSVKDNVLAILEWVPGLTKGQRVDRMRSILADLGLLELQNQRADLLSGGERRRLEICRLLVTQPRMLLLDEPFSAIDPIAVEEIQGIVRALRDRGLAILVTDHNVRETLSITDRSYIIHEGRILLEGPSAKLIADEKVRKAYLGSSFD